MVVRNRRPDPVEMAAPVLDDTATTSSAGSTSEDTMSTVNSTVEVRVWPPLVDEAPQWASGIDDKLTDNNGTTPARRLLHWGPLIALFIIAYISAVTTHFTMMWWPLTTPSGMVHFLVFMTWNYFTVTSMITASASGAGFVPKSWRPPKESDESLLQYCVPCAGYKAPRSHHCSKCGRCTMKMDHHCPWINNCVGHRNHAHFVRFLISAIFGCVHALVIHCICFYHAIHIRPEISNERFNEMAEETRALTDMGFPFGLSFIYTHGSDVLGWYLQFGDGTEPLVQVTLTSFLALVSASAFAFGVTVGLAGLLYIQMKYIRTNRTGIEDYIDSKASSRRDEDDDEDDVAAWIYPYDLGWRRNITEVLCSWSGRTRGNGIWWPVVKDCNQFTLTAEQLRQKKLKRSHARLVEITDDFAGGVFGSFRFGCKTFCCQPLNDERRIKVTKGEEWVITRGQKRWFYGHRRGDEKHKGWFPRAVAQLTTRQPYDDGAEETKSTTA